MRLPIGLESSFGQMVVLHGGRESNIETATDDEIAEWSHQMRQAASDPDVRKIAFVRLPLSEIDMTHLVCTKNEKKWDSLEIVDCTNLSTILEPLLTQLCVQRLYISLDRPFEESAASSLGYGMKTCRSSTSLSQLCISSLHWTAAAMAGFCYGLQHTATLKELNLSYNSFEMHSADAGYNEDAIDVLSNGMILNTTVSCLRLNRCNLDDDHIAIIVESCLDHPRLSKIFLGGNHCEENGMRAIARLLDRNRLTCLGLSNQTTPSPDQRSRMTTTSRQNAHLPLLYPSLQRCSSLHTLHLSSSNIGDHDIHSLCEALRGSSLVHLDLKNNRITDDGMALLSKTMPPSLERLWLLGNPFGPVGAQHLSETVTRHHWNLIDIRIPTYFGFTRNLEMQQLQLDLQYYGRLNHGGRCLLRDKRCLETVIPLGLWVHVLARVSSLKWGREHATERSRAEVIFYLIKEGPALLNR